METVEKGLPKKTFYKINHTKILELLNQEIPTTSTSETPVSSGSKIQPLVLVKSNINNNKLNNNKLNNTSDKSQGLENSILISEVIKAMEVIDPKNKTYYGNKTQRSSAEFLIKEYGLDKVLKMIAFIEVSRGNVKYLPSITSPFELKEKWQKVMDTANRNKADQKEKLDNVIW